MADQTVKYAIEIVDKWSKDLKRLESTLEKLEHKQKRAFTAAPSGKSDEFLDFINKKKTAYENLNKSAYDSTRKLGSGTDFLRDRTTQLAGAVKGVAAAYIGIQGIKALGNLAKDSYLAAAQMEKYEVTLRTMLGSQRAASERMMEYSDLALITPYQLDDVVEAGNKLQSIGRYSRENMLQLGDLAAATGKPLDQVMEAFSTLASGQTGQATKMFRNLLISTEDWAKATGKGVSKTGQLQATHEEMIKALPEILKAKGFLGMLVEQAKSTSGQIENLKGAVFRFKIALGDRLKPEMTSMVQKTTEVVRSLKSWVEVPIELKIKREKVELNNLVGALIEANDNEDMRKRLIVEIQAKYPGFLKNIDTEKLTTEQLRDRLQDVNAEYDKRAKKMFLQKRYDNLGQDISDIDDKIDAINSVAVAWEGIADAEKNLRQYVPVSGLDAQGRAVNYRNADGSLNFAAVNSFYKNVKDSPEQIDFVLAYNEYLAATDMMRKANKNAPIPIFSETDIQKLEAHKRILQEQQKKYFQKLLEDTDELFKSDDGVIVDPDPDPDSTQDFDKAQDTITGGGKSMKVINITLDSLIANNTNVFEPGQDPNSAQDFLDKLSRALTMVVNDVNYM